MSSDGKCIIVSAPSGAGKTTIVRHLMQHGLDLGFSVSATSREPRGTEQDGVDYVFLSVEDFQAKIVAGEFIEWEEVYEKQYYGTLKSEVQRIWDAGQHVIFDVDVVGGLNLKKIFSDQALAIFIEPPAISVLEERLRNRGTESEESILKRIAKAEEEIAINIGFDHIIINDVLEVACTQTVDLIRAFLSP